MIAELELASPPMSLLLDGQWIAVSPETIHTQTTKQTQRVAFIYLFVETQAHIQKPDYKEQHEYLTTLCPDVLHK